MFLKNNYQWIIATLITIIGMLFFSSCKRECSSDEIWREKIILEDGSHAYLYHSHSCSKKMQWNSVSEKITSFQKMKYDCFHYCIDKDELNILIAAHKRNINHLVEYASPDDFYDKKYFYGLLDALDMKFTSPYELKYSMLDDKIQILKKPINEFTLNEQTTK